MSYCSAAPVGEARRVVHQPPEEPEGVGLVQARGPDAVGELHLEGARLLVQLRDRAVEIRFDQRERRAR